MRTLTLEEFIEEVRRPLEEFIEEVRRPPDTGEWYECTAQRARVLRSVGIPVQEMPSFDDQETETKFLMPMWVRELTFYWTMGSLRKLHQDGTRQNDAARRMAKHANKLSATWRIGGGHAVRALWTELGR